MSSRLLGLSAILLASLVSSCLSSRRSSHTGDMKSGADSVVRLRDILQRSAPDSAPSAADSLARQQRDAALALLRLGYEDDVWPLLRLTENPSTRTYLVHSFAGAGLRPE